MSAQELITQHLDLWTSAVTTRSTAGRGRHGKIELTGIKKLRELILELAVRGKLVDQDPDDEPASVLLERIAEEKARLVKEGKIKKPKKLPEIDEDEAPFSIPHSWALARLGESVEIVRGITFPASEKSSTPEIGRVACLRTSNVQDKIEWDDILYIRDSFVSKSSQYVQKNDIIMSMANSRELVGKVAIIEKTPSEPTAFGGFLGVIRPILLHPRFLMAVLRAPHARIALIGSASQTTNIANISIGKLNPFVIGIPPIDEQQRIVDKVDELMALCDRFEQQVGDQLEAHEVLVDTLLDALTRSANATEVADNWARIAEHFDTLFTTEASIDKLKQTVLQLAVMGWLVEQDAAEESVSSLIEKIQEEKFSLSAEGNLKKIKKFPPVSVSERPYQIPNHWEWVRLGTIAEAHTGNAFKSQEYTSEGVFVLRVTNIKKDGKIDATDAKYISRKMANCEYRRFQLSEGDILLVMVGGSLGKIGIVGSNVLPAVLNQNMWKLQRFGGIHIDYFVYGLKQINANQIAITSSTHGHLAQGAYLSKLFPLPPIEEQHRIVEKVDELMAICDQLKARLGEAGETRTHLAEAVVEQAVQ